MCHVRRQSNNDSHNIFEIFHCVIFGAPIINELIMISYMIHDTTVTRDLFHVIERFDRNIIRITYRDKKLNFADFIIIMLN